MSGPDELLLKLDGSWPGGRTELGIRGRYLTRPGELSDPGVVEIKGEHVVATPGWTCSWARLEEFVPSGDNTSGAVEKKRNSYRRAANKLLASGVVRLVDGCSRPGEFGPVAAEVPLDIRLCRVVSGATDKNAPGPGSSEIPGAETAGPAVITSEVEPREDRRLRRGLKQLLEIYSFSSAQSPRESTTSSPPAFAIGRLNFDSTGLRWLESSRVLPVFSGGTSDLSDERLPPLEWFIRGIDFGLGIGAGTSGNGPVIHETLGEIAELAPEINSDILLSALTTCPNRSLGRPGSAVLAPGTVADLSIFDLPGGETGELVSGRAQARAVFRSGRLLWSSSSQLNSFCFSGD